MPFILEASYFFFLNPLPVLQWLTSLLNLNFKMFFKTSVITENLFIWKINKYYYNK